MPLASRPDAAPGAPLLPLARRSPVALPRAPRASLARRSPSHLSRAVRVPLMCCLRMHAAHLCGKCAAHVGTSGIETLLEMERQKLWGVCCAVGKPGEGTPYGQPEHGREKHCLRWRALRWGRLGVWSVECRGRPWLARSSVNQISARMGALSSGLDDLMSFHLQVWPRYRKNGTSCNFELWAPMFGRNPVERTSGRPWSTPTIYQL